MSVVRRVRRMQLWKAQIWIVGVAGLAIDRWHVGPVNNNCDNPPCTYGDASVNLYLSQPAAYTTTTKTEQNSVRNVKSEAELAVDVL